MANKAFSLKIALQDKSIYNIFIGSSILHTIVFGSKYSNYFVISDEKIEGLHASKLIKLLQKHGSNARLIKIPLGEQAKSIDVYDKVITQLIENKADRNSLFQSPTEYSHLFN
jgi:3-dehydroquinate synthetase